MLLFGLTSLAREVRGKFMALRHEDFVTAARLDGLSEVKVIVGHGQMSPRELEKVMLAFIKRQVDVLVSTTNCSASAGISAISPMNSISMACIPRKSAAATETWKLSPKPMPVG